MVQCNKGGQAMNRNYELEHRQIYEYLINEGLTEKEAKYVIDKISNAIRSCGDTANCDNFRFSIDGNNDELYEKLRNEGCCGFYDDVITLNSGKTVKFGFNFGH